MQARKRFAALSTCCDGGLSRPAGIERRAAKNEKRIRGKRWVIAHQVALCRQVVQHKIGLDQVTTIVCGQRSDVDEVQEAVGNDVHAIDVF